MIKLKIKGFTLVELIIVITILVILATIAFISYDGYTTDSRDASRLTTVKNIKDGLERYYVQTGDYPTPDDIYLTGQINGSDVNYVGYIGDDVTRAIKMNPVPLDPLTGNRYIYSRTTDKKKFQIALLQEKKKRAKVDGNYNGLLKFGDKIYNLPSLIFSGSTSSGSTDLFGTGTIFITEDSKNLPYDIRGEVVTELETPDQSLERKTGKVVTLTGVAIDQFGCGYENILGYTNDIIGLTIFGSKYFTSKNKLSCNSNVAGTELLKIDFDDNDDGYDKVTFTKTGSDNNTVGGANSMSDGDSTYIGYFETDLFKSFTHTLGNFTFNFDYKEVGSGTTKLYVYYESYCGLYSNKDDCNNDDDNYNDTIEIDLPPSNNWSTFNITFWPGQYIFAWERTDDEGNVVEGLFIDNILIKTTNNNTSWWDDDYGPGYCRDNSIYPGIELEGFDGIENLPISDEPEYSNYLEIINNNATSPYKAWKNTNPSGECYFKLNNTCAYNPYLENDEYVHKLNTGSLSTYTNWQNTNQSGSCFYSLCSTNYQDYKNDIYDNIPAVLPTYVTNLYYNGINGNNTATGSYDWQGTDPNDSCYFTHDNSCDRLNWEYDSGEDLTCGYSQCNSNIPSDYDSNNNYYSYNNIYSLSQLDTASDKTILLYYNGLSGTALDTDSEWQTTNPNGACFYKLHNSCIIYNNGEGGYEIGNGITIDIDDYNFIPGTPTAPFTHYQDTDSNAPCYAELK